MKRIFILFCVAFQLLPAMDAPVPNRFFLRDLMEAYAKGKPLDLPSKSQTTLTDIKNWIAYARNHENERIELARELQGTPGEVENALDILQFEIEQVQGSPAANAPAPPAPIRRPVVLKPIAKPAAAKPVILKPTAQPAKPASKNALLLNALNGKNVIQKQEANVIQLKTVDQFKLGSDVSPATCPVQALRNTLILLRFVSTGLPSILDDLESAQDARKFLEKVEKCGVGIQWLTAEELKRIINKAGDEFGPFANSITALDTPQELMLYPDQLKELQNKFKQQNAAQGFIIGTMDMGQFTGERGHYFSFVTSKNGPDYLYLIADTAPGSNHLDQNSYNYKRVAYMADIITKGRSDINLDAELQKIAGSRYRDLLARALERGALFDFKSLSKNELEGLENAVQEADRNKAEWKNRMRMNDAQLGTALNIVKKSIRDRLATFKKP